MAVNATIRRLFNARQHCFVEMLTKQMEGKESQENYWAWQLGNADDALREACARYGVPFPDVPQLPLFLSGDDGVTFVRHE